MKYMDDLHREVRRCITIRLITCFSYIVIFFLMAFILFLSKA